MRCGTNIQASANATERCIRRHARIGQHETDGMAEIGVGDTHLGGHFVGIDQQWSDGKAGGIAAGAMFAASFAGRPLLALAIHAERRVW